MFSWPMITGALDGGDLYSFTSVPQIPATSIFMSALSSGISGMGNSRISVRLGPTLTAANTFSTCVPPVNYRPFAFSHARVPSPTTRPVPPHGTAIPLSSTLGNRASRNDMSNLNAGDPPKSGGPVAGELIADLAAASRVLVAHGVVDAFGHVSM